jgi:hypothetical protein
MSVARGVSFQYDASLACSSNIMSHLGEPNRRPTTDTRKRKGAVEQRWVGSLDLALGACSAESGNKEKYKTNREMNMVSPFYFACQGASCVTE